MAADVRADLLAPLPPDCVRARFVKRVKRFTVHAETRSGPVLAHTNNTGAMLGLLRPGAELLLSPAADPARKLPYTLEMVRLDGFWAGVNTAVPNRVLAKAWEFCILPEPFRGGRPRMEVKAMNSRFDAGVMDRDRPVIAEAKNVTLVEGGAALFPDAPSGRGRKHLEDMIGLAGQGADVGVFYLVQRPDAECFAPADMVDPEYAELFAKALRAGVRMLPWRARTGPEGVGLDKPLPLARWVE